MSERVENNVYRTYKLDYVGRYYFYEEEDLLKFKENGQYILDNLKKSNRFDFDNASYTFTKFGNVSEGRTERDVTLEIENNSIDVKMNGENVHLDLIYKMDVKKLEDHYRITTRISEKGNSVSVLMYAIINDGEDVVQALEGVKKYQEILASKSSE